MHLSDAELNQLATHGYLTLDAAAVPDLMRHYAEVFRLSSEYFALNDTDTEKQRYRAPTGPGASEEGYSRIPGEKQIFTCRGYNRTPLSMRDKAKQAWDATGIMLQQVMNQVADDLSLDTVPSQGEGAGHGSPFEPLLDRCLRFTDHRTPTLLRLFRYDRPAADANGAATRKTAENSGPVTDQSLSGSNTSHIVAERHKDLGLLSVVVGSSPGLEVLNEQTNTWIAIENERDGQEEQHGKLTITLLVGQCLRYLSRNTYRAGVHRVRVFPRTLPDGAPDPYRFSIVYALRPYPGTVNLSTFESERVGHFTADERAGIDGASAAVLYNKICGQHWNINISKDIREQQRHAALNPSPAATHPTPVVHDDARLTSEIDRSTRHEMGEKSKWMKRKWATVARALSLSTQSR